MEITPITENNVKYFSPLIMKYLRHSIWEQGVIGIGAVKDEIACGALILYCEEEVATILSVYVAPAYRRMNIGTRLFDKAEEIISKMVGEENVIQIFYDESYKADQAFQSFLKKKKFSLPQPIGKRYFIKLEDITLQVGIKKLKREKKILALQEVDPFVFQAYQNKISRKAAQGFVTFAREDIDLEKSMAYLENGEIKDMVVFLRGEELVFDTGRIVENPTERLFFLLQAAVEKARKSYNGKTTIIFQTLNEVEETIVKLLAKEKWEVKNLAYVSQRIQKEDQTEKEMER